MQRRSSTPLPLLSYPALSLCKTDETEGHAEGIIDGWCSPPPPAEDKRRRQSQVVASLVAAHRETSSNAREHMSLDESAKIQDQEQFFGLIIPTVDGSNLDPSPSGTNSNAVDTEQLAARARPTFVVGGLQAGFGQQSEAPLFQFWSLFTLPRCSKVLVITHVFYEIFAVPFAELEGPVWVKATAMVMLFLAMLLLFLGMACESKAFSIHRFFYWFSVALTVVALLGCIRFFSMLFFLHCR